MKKLLVTLSIFMMTVFFFTQPEIQVSASEKSDSIKMLSAYQKGDFATAQKYAKKLKKRTSDPCEKKMSVKMKKAYQNVVKSYNRKGASYGKYPYYVWDVYYADLNGDKKPELLFRYGNCEATVEMYVYQYKNSKAVKVGTTIGFHSQYAYCPGYNGIIARSFHMGYEHLYRVSMKNGKLVTTSYGFRGPTYTPLKLKQELKSKIKYSDF